MIVTDDEALARRAKHLTTTAKIPHPYEFVHDEVGYNYRLPNLNAALGCAQMERLPQMLAIKAEVAARYRAFFAGTGVRFVLAGLLAVAAVLMFAQASARIAARSRATISRRGSMTNSASGMAFISLMPERYFSSLASSLCI